MNKRINILITSAGSTNGVNVIKALREQREILLNFVAADMNPLAAGLYMADKSYSVPGIADSEFIPQILEICEKEKIKIIIPTHSSELPVFAKNKKIFDEAGIKMAISDYETFSITDDKIKTSDFFKKEGIPFPKIYTEEEIAAGKVKFPVFIKPVKASGSREARKIENQEELSFFSKTVKNNFIQAFAEGEEYTIDGVCDFGGKMIAASPRVRLEKRGGLAIKSVTKSDPEILNYTKKIVEGLRIKGPFNIQCFKSGKELKFIEVNARFPSGGLPLTVKAGLNIPLILIKMILGMKISKPKIKSGLAMTRFYDSIILEKSNGKYKIYKSRIGGSKQGRI